VAVSCFSGFPSMVDKVLAARPPDSGLTGLVLAFTSHQTRDVRIVGRRQAAALGILAPDVVEPLLASPVPAERLSGAECAVRLSLEPLHERAAALFRAATTRSPDDADLRVLGIEPPTGGPPGHWGLRARHTTDAGDLGKRLLWALDGATVDFADLLAIVADRLPYDQSEGIMEPEGERIVAAVVKLLCRWGPPGAIAVLELMDDEEVEDDFTIREEIQHAAESDASVLDAVRDGAERGGRASTEVLAELTQRAFDRGLGLLARQLADEVFPPGWPDAPIS